MTTRNPQQLLLVKQLYEDARTLASREDDLSLIKAIVALDLAVEQMLNTVIMDFTSVNAPTGKPGRSDVGWGVIWERAAEAMKGKNHALLNHGPLLRLHEVRNLAVHNGSVPSQGEIHRYIEPTEEMLTGVFRDGYSVDFQRFRLWDLVPNDGLRQLLIDSESALEKGHPAVCIFGCIQVHNLIIGAIRTLTRSRRFRFAQASPVSAMPRDPYPPGVPFEVRSRLEDAARQVEREINRRESNLRNEIRAVKDEMALIEDELVSTGIGMPLLDTRRFQRIGDQVMISIGRGLSATFEKIFKDSAEELADGALFMLGYLSRLIRLVNDTYPEVVDRVTVNAPLTSQDVWKNVEAKPVMDRAAGGANSG